MFGVSFPKTLKVKKNKAVFKVVIFPMVKIKWVKLKKVEFLRKFSFPPFNYFALLNRPPIIDFSDEFCHYIRVLFGQVIFLFWIFQ